MRRLLALFAVVAMVAIVVIGLTQAGANDPAKGPGYDLPEAQQRLQGAPAPLAQLHDEASTLISGGKPAFEQRLAELKGHPVVINKWASWCAPCQAEFGVFESVGTERGKEVAFLGLNGNDKDPRAREFLAKRWLPFPSYTDPQEDIAEAIQAPKNYPITVFVDKMGRTAYIHSGPYKSDKQLNDDIDKYFEL
jgi:cytochrome c biogenesis protein CcmG, thiol:disulfide interchange protein DsbE